MNTLYPSSKLLMRLILSSLLLLTAILPVMADQKTTLITFWTINPPGLDVTGDWLEEKIREFEAANPGFLIEHSFWENQSYKIRLKVAMFGDEGPDILFNWGGESQLLFSREGLLYDLTEELGEDKWGLSPGMFATHSYNGRIYGVPIFPSVQVVWYNRDLFSRHGWKTPHTWDEFLTLCAQIKAQGYIPVAMGGQEPWTILYPYMYLVDRLAGNDLYLAAKARQKSFTDPGFVEAFRLLNDLAEEGYLPTEVLSLSYMEATQLLTQNKALMMFMGDWEYQRLTNQLRQNLDRWDFFPFPIIPDGKGSPASIVGAVAGYSIRKSENSEDALKFLRYLSGKESLAESYKKTGKLVALATPYIGENNHPQIKKIARLLAEASSLTQWWDQDLPEPVTQALLQSLQDLLAKRRTPEQAAEMIEEAYHKYQ